MEKNQYSSVIAFHKKYIEPQNSLDENHFL